MIYDRDGDLVIRDLEEADAEVFFREETAQGWHADISKYLGRLKDRAEGKCVALAAEYRGQPAGYVNLYLKGREGPFCETGYPVIVDFAVLEKYRGRGIGTLLMDTAERIAGQYADTVWLGVGLHNGYGSAQRMYVRRGYVPDGSGVWYNGKPCTPYDTVYTNDDDLILYMSKKLPAAPSAGEGKRGPEASGTPVRAAAEDLSEAAELACGLWPYHTREEMEEDIASQLADEDAAVFLYRENGRAAGLAFCGLRRDYVEGTGSSPVGYLEGIYVRESDRHRGIARLLLKACEDWARERGCTEFASDCELTNTVSQQFHQAVGFREANRIVAYVRGL